MTLRELLVGIVAIFAVFGSITYVAARNAILEKASDERRYRETCVSVKGLPAWNGQHWECLK